MDKKKPNICCFSLFHVLFVISHLWHGQVLHVLYIILFEYYDKSKSQFPATVAVTNFPRLPLATHYQLPIPRVCHRRHLNSLVLATS